MPLLAELHAKRDAIYALAARHGITNIRVFGSVARQEDDADSDVDFLISIDPARSLTELIRFRLDLQTLLVHQCDVVSDRGLHRMIRDDVLREATLL